MEEWNNTWTSFILKHTKKKSSEWHNEINTFRKALFLPDFQQQMDLLVVRSTEKIPELLFQKMHLTLASSRLRRVLLSMRKMQHSFRTEWNKIPNKKKHPLNLLWSTEISTTKKQHDFITNSCAINKNATDFLFLSYSFSRWLVNNIFGEIFILTSSSSSSLPKKKKTLDFYEDRKLFVKTHATFYLENELNWFGPKKIDVDIETKPNYNGIFILWVSRTNNKKR